MKILLIDNHTRHMADLMHSLKGHDVRLQKYQPGIKFQDKDVDLVILSGGGGEGKELRQLGLKLAYHTHDAEMREGAREFHHMLVGTQPENVHLCLDAHWIYRGAGNSQVALFDIVNLYADRIVELHLRQSHDGTWSEVFEAGDVDYERLAEMLISKNLKPHVVLEQAVEEGTPHTMDTVAAMQKSLAYVHEVFDKLVG